MLEQAVIHLQRSRKARRVDRGQLLLEFAVELNCAGSRLGADVVELSVKAMIAELRCPNWRQLGESAHVALPQLVKGLIHRRFSRSISHKRDDGQQHGQV